MKTSKEIENLKNNWKEDPSWNIYNTEGFEEHIEELKKYQEEQKKLWQKESQNRDIKQVQELGIPLEKLDYAKNLIRQSEDHKNSAARTLLHYFKLTADFTLDSEHQGEIEYIVHDIINSAVAEVKLYLLTSSKIKN